MTAHPFSRVGKQVLSNGHHYADAADEQAGDTAVAALYVETDGCYFGLPGVDPWDEVRDARTYAGPHPVVAHPPCQRWGALAFVNFARWGGEHNRPRNDGGCFAAALHAVRLWGGVLEHPAKSRAWDWFGLTKPGGIGWTRCVSGGWVCEVWQSAYGHQANKATWLYANVAMPPALDWRRPAGTHQIGFPDQRGKDRNKPTLGKREAAATPIPFRDVLLSIARTAKPHTAPPARPLGISDYCACHGRAPLPPRHSSPPARSDRP